MPTVPAHLAQLARRCVCNSNAVVTQPPGTPPPKPPMQCTHRFFSPPGRMHGPFSMTSGFTQAANGGRSHNTQSGCQSTMLCRPTCSLATSSSFSGILPPSRLILMVLEGSTTFSARTVERCRACKHAHRQGRGYGSAGVITAGVSDKLPTSPQLAHLRTPG